MQAAGDTSAGSPLRERREGEREREVTVCAQVTYLYSMYYISQLSVEKVRF